MENKYARTPQYIKFMEQEINNMLINNEASRLMSEFISAADSVGITQAQGDYVIKAMTQVLLFHKVPAETLQKCGLSIFSELKDNSMYYELAIKYMPLGDDALFRHPIEFPVNDKQMGEITAAFIAWIKIVEGVKP